MKYPRLWLHGLLSVVLLLGLGDRAPAQVTPQTTGPGITGTNVSAGPNFSIAGGQRFGSNLFHSFDQFNLQSTETATFSTQGADNILARIVGGNASVINGVIQTSNPASLYLMNPAGLLFGQNAVVNIQGSFVATTAHGIGLSNNLWFHAAGANDYNLLTARPTVLGFNGPSGSIVNSGQLSATGNGFEGPAQLALVGSTVVNTGNLKAQEQGIAIATVNAAKTVRLGIGSDILTLDVAPPTATMPTAWSLPVVTLPELITGGNLSLVTQVVKEADGTIRLQSQSKGSIGSGDIATTGLAQVNRDENPYGINLQAQNNLTITGETAVRSNSLAAPSALKLVSGRDLQTATLNIDYGPSSVRDERLVLSSQGKVETGNIDRFPSVTITGSDLNLADVNLGDRANQISAPGLLPPEFTAMSTTGAVNTGAITASGGTVNITAQGDLTTGRINTFPSDFSPAISPIPLDGGIRLESKTGNVVSQSFRSGTAGIKVTTPGILRVYGTDPSDIDGAIQTVYLSLNKNPDLVNYLVSLGVPLSKIQSASSSGTTYIPVVYFSKGNVVSYGDPSDQGKIPDVESLEQNIGVKPFYTGGLSPDYSINSGNPLTDFNPNLNRGGNPNPDNTQPFQLERRYLPLNEFPAGVSGSPIGIVRLEGSNAALVGSTTSRPFIPPAPDPNPIAPPVTPPSPVSPPVATPPENSPVSRPSTATSETVGDRPSKPSLTCGKSQIASANCRPENPGDAILKILEQ